MYLTINSFHDAELNAVTHDRSAGTLALSFLFPDGSISTISFGGVVKLRIVDYGSQNVVSRLLISIDKNLNDDEITESVVWAFGTLDGGPYIEISELKKLVQEIKNNDRFLFILEPSWGAELIVIAREMKLTSTVNGTPHPDTSPLK